MFGSVGSTLLMLSLSVSVWFRLIIGSVCGPTPRSALRLPPSPIPNALVQLDPLLDCLRVELGLRGGRLAQKGYHRLAHLRPPG